MWHRNEVTPGAVMVLVSTWWLWGNRPFSEWDHTQSNKTLSPITLWTACEKCFEISYSRMSESMTKAYVYVFTFIANSASYSIIYRRHNSLFTSLLFTLFHIWQSPLGHRLPAATAIHILSDKWAVIRVLFVPVTRTILTNALFEVWHGSYWKKILFAPRFN